MSEELANELRAISARLTDIAETGSVTEVQEPLTKIDDVVSAIAKSWSGSNLGYQSRVYYADFAVPPPGAHFDSEWGFLGEFQGTTGDWLERQSDDVKAHIYERAGVSSLDDQLTLAEAAREAWRNERPEVVSILSTQLAAGDDRLMTGLLEEAQQVNDLTDGSAAAALVGRVGNIMTRDTTALSQGFMAAPHQMVKARVVAIRSTFNACKNLAHIADRAASHIARIEASQSSRGQNSPPAGDRVFIGHGGSPLWRELKDFFSERLGLPWDEFNRVPVAGVTNIARLSEMLDNAAIAFLVLTAEDETATGQEQARQNVVHEAGLFQGRLGFGRAIILLEEGCEQFSNIEGLGQIRFPPGQIAIAFEEVRRVLERENFLEE